MKFLRGLGMLAGLVLLTLALVAVVAWRVFDRMIWSLHFAGVRSFFGMDVNRAWYASGVAAAIAIAGVGVLHLMDRASRRR